MFLKTWATKLNTAPFHPSSVDLWSIPNNIKAVHGFYDEICFYFLGLKTLKLKDYQVPVAEKSLRGENDIILLPTGAGKTYIAIKIIIEHLHAFSNGEQTVGHIQPAGYF